MPKIFHQYPQVRGANWVETYTGRRFWPTNPRPDEVDIKDIAHALSNLCRFNGHTFWHYSVAQHCLLCADYAARDGLPVLVQLHCLLHDAAEAYLGDIVRPIKPEITGFEYMENRLQVAILEGLGVESMSRGVADAVQRIDDIMCNLEARTLLSNAEWAKKEDGLGIVIDKQDPDMVSARYLMVFDRLRGELEEEQGLRR